MKFYVAFVLQGTSAGAICRKARMNPSKVWGKGLGHLGLRISQRSVRGCSESLKKYQKGRETCR